MTTRDDDLHVRPGRIGDTPAPTRRARSFVSQVMRAVRKAGQTGTGFGRSARNAGRSRFGRGRASAAQAALRWPSRRVVITARVVRHQGTRFRSASLVSHIGYLQRDGVTRDGAKAQLFDTSSDNADGRDFAERCTDDRHHFRFIVSPEDAPALADLKTWTRDLMRQAEHDLGSRLDWVAVDHWNTDNPHVHVLVRGRAEHGSDLVIARDYLSRGFRGRAEALVELELGPRTDKEIRSALESEVGAERWTGLDRALRAAADEGGGILDLRPADVDAADLHPTIPFRWTGHGLEPGVAAMRRPVADALGTACADMTAPEGRPPPDQRITTYPDTAAAIVALRARDWASRAGPHPGVEAARPATCLVYSGHAGQARSLVRAAWPDGTPGLAETERQIAARIAFSPFVAAVRAANAPGASFTTAACRPNGRDQTALYGFTWR